MQLFTFHLAKSPLSTTLRALMRPPTAKTVPGLTHAECMTQMKLGAAILSPSRLQLRNLAMFAAWESDAAIDAFLTGTKLGRVLAAGWHVRLAFQRRWGRVKELPDLPETGEQDTGGAGYIPAARSSGGLFPGWRSETSLYNRSHLPCDTQPSPSRSSSPPSSVLASSRRRLKSLD